MLKKILIVLLATNAYAQKWTGEQIWLQPKTLPTTGKNGMLRVETSTNKLKKYNEATATWQEISGGGGGSGVGGLSWLANGNPRYEDLLVGWSETGGGTLSTANAGANLLEGTYSATYDASAASDYLESTAVTPPNGLKNGNCVVSVRIKGDASLYQLKAIVGATEYTLDLDNYSDSHTYYLFYPCGDLSVTSKVRIEATGNGAALAIDDWYAGDASPLLSQVDGSSLAGTLVYPNATNCIWQSTNAAYANFAADADCTGAVATGALTAPGTLIPGFVYNDMPAGEYVILASGGFQSDAGSAPCGYRISDGTSQSGSMYGVENSARDFMQAHYSYSEAADRTFQIQAISDGVNDCDVFNSGGLASAVAPLELKFTVIRLPQAEQLAIKPGDESWRVDVNISGANPDLGIATVASYTEITDGGLTMVSNGGLTPQIPCSSTNPSTGLTCGAGNEGIGVVFNLPKAIPYQVCAEFSSYIESGTGNSVEQAFQWVETSNTSQTILAEGNSRVQAALNNAGAVFPHRNCGIFYPTTSGQKTLRLMYEQVVTGTPTASQVYADGGNPGQKDVHITVTPWLGLANSPLLVNSVVSSSSVVETINRVRVTSTCSSDPCTIADQSGSWVSAINWSSTGVYIVNFTAGVFSSGPTCTVTNGNGYAYFQTQPNTTGFTFQSRDSSSTLADSTFHVLCIGPKN